MITAEYCSTCQRVAPADDCEIHGEGMRCTVCGGCDSCDAEWFEADECDYDDD